MMEIDDRKFAAILAKIIAQHPRLMLGTVLGGDPATVLEEIIESNIPAILSDYYVIENVVGLFKDNPC